MNIFGCNIFREYPGPLMYTWPVIIILDEGLIRQTPGLNGLEKQAGMVTHHLRSRNV